MLSYDDALARILSKTKPLTTQTIPVAQANGRALAEPIVAPENLPPFDNSMVDGYAVGEPNPESPAQWEIQGEIFAGQTADQGVGLGEALYIATGAMIPPSTTGIVMVEDTQRTQSNVIQITEAPSAKFIRRAGSDVRQGQTVLHPGDTVDAGTIGLLSALGIMDIPCVARPRVAILSTGNELVSAKTQFLPAAKIRDANGPALEAAVLAAGGIVQARLHAEDDPEELRSTLLALTDCNVVITSGGVSVGGADFVKSILEEIGTLDFWRIAIRPGKPLAFGTIGNALFFGLPGNPVSSLVTFELFVRPVLRRLAGHTTVLRPQTIVTLTEALPHEPGRREFARAYVTYENGIARATPTGAQGSHRFASLLGANALLIAHEDHGDYATGEQLPAFLV